MESEHRPSRLPTVEMSRRLHGTALAGVLLALMLTLLLEALDQTIVGTAMPRIIGQLHGLNLYTWAVTAYLLASTTLIPIAGKLSDQFGRKWFLLGGTMLFLLGSALCGAAHSIEQLIVFRALQGAGAGSGIALVFTTVGDIFPSAERARWQGVVNSVYAISAVIGPTLGGFLADHGPLLGSLVSAASRWPIVRRPCIAPSSPSRRASPPARITASSWRQRRDRHGSCWRRSSLRCGSPWPWRSSTAYSWCLCFALPPP